MTNAQRAQDIAHQVRWLATNYPPGLDVVRATLEAIQPSTRPWDRDDLREIVAQERAKYEDGQMAA